jgi:hypothetical protein
VSDGLAALLTSGAFGLGMGGLVWLARRVRSRGTGGGYSIMGVFDEMWHPAALEARVVIQRHDERQAPAPLPGGPVPGGQVPESSNTQ